MGALIGISLWVALATVVPGLVTIAVLQLCFVAAGITPSLPESEWVIAGIAVTVMVLTQALGILLEELLIRFRLLGRRLQTVLIPDPRTPDDNLEYTINPYEQYAGLYFVLSRLSEHDDSQGHLKRAIAQFFLTNNTLVSFAIGAILALVLAANAGHPEAGRLLLCGIGFLMALVLSYWSGVIRFREMARSLWAVQVDRPVSGTEAVDTGRIQDNI